MHCRNVDRGKKQSTKTNSIAPELLHLGEDVKGDVGLHNLWRNAKFDGASIETQTDLRVLEFQAFLRYLHLPSRDAADLRFHELKTQSRRKKRCTSEIVKQKPQCQKLRHSVLSRVHDEEQSFHKVFRSSCFPIFVFTTPSRPYPPFG